MARIEHFALFTDDLERLKTFYTGALGLRMVVDNSQAPVAGYFLADDGGGVLEIIARPAGTPAFATRYTCHVAFSVADYEAARAEMEARGARFEVETEVISDSMKTGFFDDPAGNRLQVVWRASPLGS